MKNKHTHNGYPIGENDDEPVDGMWCSHNFQIKPFQTHLIFFDPPVYIVYMYIVYIVYIYIQYIYTIYNYYIYTIYNIYIYYIYTIYILYVNSILYIVYIVCIYIQHEQSPTVGIEDRQGSCVQSCALAHRDGRSEKTEAAIEASCYVPTIGNIFISGIF